MLYSKDKGDIFLTFVIREHKTNERIGVCGSKLECPLFALHHKTTRSSMATMHDAQVAPPNGPFERVERPIPEPDPGSVRIKVLACGVCHSDAFTNEGDWLDMQYPRALAMKWPV